MKRQILIISVLFLSIMGIHAQNDTMYVHLQGGLVSKYAINQIDSITFYQDSIKIGDQFGGGVVAYIFQPGDPGYVAGEVHGLIAAQSDLTPAPWGCSGTLIGGTATGIGSGANNTTTIIGACTTAGIAALLCNNLVLNSYSDWYLPSKDELNKLYQNRNIIGGFTTSAYWSSSENGANYGWAQNFDNGGQGSNSKGSTNNIRAIRTF